MAFTLAQRMLRTAGLFQGLVALPTLLVMGEAVFEQIFFYYYYIRIYSFITAVFNSLMAAGVLFLIIIQRSSGTTLSKRLTLLLEAIKSLLATLVWVWLVADSIWGPQRRYYSPPYPGRGRRIATSVISVVCLLFLFYPTLAYAYFDAKKGESDEDPEREIEAGGEGDERTALLRR